MTYLLTDPAELPGLLFSIQFDAHGAGRKIEPGTAPLPPEPGDGFLWLHLDLIDGRVEDFVAEGRFAPPALATATFARDDHQRIVVEGPWIGLVLCDREREFDGTVADLPTGRLHCLMGPRTLITGRRHATAGAEAAHDAVLAGQRAASPAQLLELCIAGVIQSTHAAAVSCSDAIDAIEDRVLDAEGAAETGSLAPLRRKAVRLNRQLSGLRAVFHRLEAELDAEPEGRSDTVALMAARVAQRLDAIHRDMHLLEERSRLLQDEIAARSAAQANRQLFTLSILTALFLPPTLVTGIFGMNTKGLFLASFDEGSTIALILCASAAFAVYLVIRRLGLVRRRG